MAETLKEKREARRRKRDENPETELVESSEKNITEGKGRATPSRRKGEIGGEKKESGNFVVRSFNNVREYIGGVRSEISKVTWPTREETTRLTWIVTAVTVISALFLGGLSIIFTEIFNVGVNQPLIFVGVFVAFLVLFFVYVRFTSRNNTEANY